MIRSTIATLFACGLSVVLPAADLTWTGTAGDGLWSTAGNWSGSAVPGPTDKALLTATPVVKSITVGDARSLANLSVAGAWTLSGAGPLAVSGALTMGNASLRVPADLLDLAVFEQSGSFSTISSETNVANNGLHLAGGAERSVAWTIRGKDMNGLFRRLADRSLTF